MNIADKYFLYVIQSSKGTQNRKMKFYEGGVQRD